MKKKVVVAFSGGLDTSLRLSIWLKKKDTRYTPLALTQVVSARNN